VRLSFGAVPVAALLVAFSYAPAAAAPTLDGTSWRLIEIVSMDDQQGTTPVPDPGKFTVTFGADGRAAFQIDCNRGSSSWQVKPGGSGVAGELIFGAIATTRMACPQPSLDQRVSTALPLVRGYLIKDDRLHMSLQADGGVLTWEPMPS
jgi:heat shock protein HslJ